MTSTPFRDFAEAFDWLSSRTNYETMAVQSYDARTYGLDRVVELLETVGRPDREFDAVQIVGSKGKGSTAACLASILRADGRRVGLYTSPHLIDARERIVVDGDPAPDDVVVRALETVRGPAESAAARGTACTFFELHTVAALLAFRELGCETVVLEAGMGGRLDATTAAEAQGVVLTTVSRDHTRQLGETVEAIAAEKAAAFRAGCPAISGVGPGHAAFDTVERAARTACAAPLIALGRDAKLSDVTTALAPDGVATTRFRLDRSGPSRRSDVHELPLLGTHQAHNAALAVLAAENVAWRRPVSSAAVRDGLRRARIRARLDVVARDPLVIVDGAHSPASCTALAEALLAAVPRAPRVLVVGMADDKDVEGSLAALAPAADFVVATAAASARAAAPARILAAVRAAGLDGEQATDIRTALSAARTRASRAGTAGCVVVTGSLYLCGEALGDEALAL